MSRVESYQMWGLLLLGALHGVNPGMGWLFAVARGFQEQARRAVWGTLGPLAAGHALAIAGAVSLAALLGAVIPIGLLRSLAGAGLIVRGGLLLVRHRHPRGGGMQMNARGLAWWSFVMATGHGAGLMALPLVLSSPAAGGAQHLHGAHGLHGVVQLSLGTGLHWTALVATTVHTVGYLTVTALVAVIVYERVGLRMLRSAWINVNLLWAAALIVTGAATLIV